MYRENDCFILLASPPMCSTALRNQCPDAVSLFAGICTCSFIQFADEFRTLGTCKCCCQTFFILSFLLVIEATTGFVHLSMIYGHRCCQYHYYFKFVQIVCPFANLSVLLHPGIAKIWFITDTAIDDGEYRAWSGHSSRQGTRGLAINNTESSCRHFYASYI